MISRACNTGDQLVPDIREAAGLPDGLLLDEDVVPEVSGSQNLQS